MEDRLDSIFAMQKGLENMMNLDRYPKDTEGTVSALWTATVAYTHLTLPTIYSG